MAGHQNARRHREGPATEPTAASGLMQGLCRTWKGWPQSGIWCGRGGMVYQAGKRDNLKGSQVHWDWVVGASVPMPYIRRVYTCVTENPEE